MLDHPEMKRFERVSDLLSQRGWAEANAGNLSIRLGRDTGTKVPGPLKEIPLDHPFPTLDGEFYLVTATGRRARDISRVPDQTVGLVEIINEGQGIRCHWGKLPPTSEFPAHLSIYAMCMEFRPEMQAVLHTHPPHLIAISHITKFRKAGALNKALRMMHPEVGILVPDGISTMDYRIPGSLELGMATSEVLKDRNITMWPMHGVVSIAPDLDKALDQIEILEKAAMMYMLVLSTGREPAGLTDTQIRESREFWGIGDKK